MLPTYTVLFEGHRWLCRSRSIRYAERDLHDAQIGIARARLVAASLADREEDEPAALLLALMLEADALGDAQHAFPIFAVRNFVRRSQRLDLVLDLADRIELRTIRAHALARRNEPDRLRVVFDDLCTFLSARLRPLP